MVETEEGRQLAGMEIPFLALCAIDIHGTIPAILQVKGFEVPISAYTPRQNFRSNEL